MPTTGGLYLPTEILLIIAAMLWFDQSYDPDGMKMMERQKTFYNFCLVSRQWYSVGIPHLYRVPQIWQGNKFLQFTNTVCPPRGAKKSQMDFGSLVKILHLGSLVHQSSNSLTSRLLSRVKKSLVVFIAPQTGISVNSLASIAKCHQLRQLDLSLVRGGMIGFSLLKRTVSNLPELLTLNLPSGMELATSTGHWPSKLSSMVIGGTLSADLMADFDWPPNIRRIELKQCKNLDTPILESLLSNQQIRTKLEALIIDRDNRDMFTDELDTTVLYGLERLFYLKVPLDFVEFLAILPPPSELHSLPLRILELTSQYYQDEVQFDFADELQAALDQNLRHLWALGVGESSLRYIEEAYSSIDDKIWSHIEAYPEDELTKAGIDDVGIYTIDDDPLE